MAKRATEADIAKALLQPHKQRKTGKPKALEVVEDREDEPSLEEFVKEMHGEGGPTEPQDGMPSMEWLKQQFKTKSAAVRYLVSEQCAKDLNRLKPDGTPDTFQVKQIAKHLGMRYQHVRNVAKSPLKRGPNEDWRPKQKPTT